MRTVVVLICISAILIMAGIDAIILVPRFGLRKRCSVLTRGRVTGYRVINSGNHIHCRCPVIQYAVHGNMYRTWGPRLSGNTSVRVHVPDQNKPSVTRYKITEKACWLCVHTITEARYREYVK